MSEVKRVFSKDAPYSGTQIPVEKSKDEIDRVLRKYGVTKIAWTFDPEHDDIEVHFQFEEDIEGKTVTPVVALRPPEIWKSVHGYSKREQRIVKGDVVYWPQAMRCLFWYIKTHMEMTKLGYSKTQEFLPHVAAQLKDGTEVKIGDILIPRIGDVAQIIQKTAPMLEEKEVAK